jgi:cobalamin biosynthesis protein CobD/CbiB
MPQGVAWLPPAMLLAALLLDMMFGSPAVAGRIPGLARIFARPALFFTKRLDRPARTSHVLAVRGAIVAALLLLFAAALGIVLHRLTRSWEGGLAAELLILSSGLALRRPFVAVRRALAKTKIAAEHTAMRTAIEQTAGALESGLALPVAA